MKENEKEEPPVTDADLARVAELDAKATKGPWRAEDDNTVWWQGGCILDGFEKQLDSSLIAEYRTLCPRIARELIAARAQIAADAEKLKVARMALENLGQHDGDCHMSKRAACAGAPPPGHPLHEAKCDCGLWAAITQLDAKP